MPSSLTCCCLVAKLCPTIATPWTVAHQAPLSMDFPGKNTGVGGHFLLQWIFPTQGSNLCLRHWQADSLPLSHQLLLLLLSRFSHVQACATP